MDTLLKDLQYALRGLRRHPGFSTVAIVTIGLGIGACTAIFSVVNTVLLRPLPYSDPERLVLVWSELRTRNVLDFPMPIPDLRDVRQTSTTIEGAAGMFPPGRVAVSGDDGEAEQVRSVGATPNIFQVLGVRVALGRDFTEADGTPLSPPPAGATPQQQGPPLPQVAILSHQFWQRRFGGNPNVVGTVIGFGNG